MAHYGMTKAARLAVSRGMAGALAGSGVTVNAVLPGPTLSEGVRAMLEDEISDGRTLAEVGSGFPREERPTQLLGRLTEPEEVANLVVYVDSPVSSATTGAGLRADGGTVRAIP